MSKESKALRAFVSSCETQNEEPRPALVPKLRFPEFRGAEGWSEEVLSDVATIVMGSSPKSECYNQSEIGLPLLQGNADIKNRLSAPRIFTSEITKECAIGDILLSVRAPVGSVAKSVHHACIGRGIAAVRADHPNDQEFVYQWLLSYESRWVGISQGGTFDAVNSDDLKGVAFAVPRPPEQQKIAECLSSVDELMAAQARKVDALKTHKKGLMQELFPREGETQPRLRFPEFQNAGKWEETRLGQLGKLVSGLTYSPDDVRDSGLLVLRSSNVQNGAIALDDNVYVDPAIKGANLSQPNDILICVRNGSKALIGKSALIPEGMPLCTHGAFMTVFRARTPGFVFQLFQTAKYQKLVSGDLGATINSINGSHLLKYKFFIPKPDEQQRIASCLNSLDALITAETQRLEALKTHKKGLMQQLFPSPAEVEA